MIAKAIKSLVAQPAGWVLSAPLRPAGVTVLMYHRITRRGEPFHGTEREMFREQMRWLRRNCEPIHPGEYAARVNRRAARTPVLVTFDDGYRDFHDNAYPILEELRIPALVFLATSFVGTTRMIWTDAVWSAFNRTALPDVEFPWAAGTRHGLADAPSRSRAERLAKHFLKDIPDTERQRWQAELFARLAIDPEDGTLGRQMLSWDEIRATRAHACYGGHTHTHPILSQLPAQAADEEIRLSSAEIRRELGEAPRYFAYPNGRAQDFNEANRESLRRHGFELGFSTIEGVNGPGADPFAIRRQPTGASSIADFAWLVAGR